MKTLLANASVRELRSFGLLVGGLFAAIGGWWIYRGRFPVAAPVLLGVGAVLAVSNLQVVPIVIVLLLVGLLLIVSQGSAVAPFVYTLF